MEDHTNAGREGPRRGTDHNGPRVTIAAIGFVCAAFGIAIAQDTGMLPRFPILLSEISAITCQGS